MKIAKLLRDPSRYEAQIHRLHEKYLAGNRLYKPGADGVAFASISFDSRKFARMLARTVAAGRYRAQPARTRVVMINNKGRKLYEFHLNDVIVHAVVATALNEAMMPLLSPRLYSYRKGVCWSDALADFSAYVRRHRKACALPQERGLYVVRRDVTKYTDSIPVGAHSSLWPVLREALGIDGPLPRRQRKFWELAENVIRPEIVSEEGLLYSNITGVPTGSPISTTLFNLYLTAMDRALSAIPGAFYARYSDDFLFAHPDAEVVREADRIIDHYLDSQGLCSHKTKDDDLFFNGAGRGSAAWPEARGTTTVSFLGCRVSFEGTVSLEGRKVKQLYGDVSRRARRTKEAVGAVRPEDAGPIVCAAINDSLNPRSPCHQQSSLALRSVVTDRGQLRDIDYNIARIVAQTLSGVHGVRAFRTIGYRTLRQRWGLNSLLHLRNRMR